MYCLLVLVLCPNTENPLISIHFLHTLFLETRTVDVSDRIRIDKKLSNEILCH